MKFLPILAIMLLAQPAFAEEPKCYQKTITVCPMKHKKAVPAPIPAPAPEPVVIEKEVVRYTIVEKKVPYPVYVNRTVVKEKLVCPSCPPDHNSIGLRAAVGVQATDPYFSGLLGLRFQFPRAWIGLDIFSQFQYGFGAQLLTYVYRGDILKVHVGDPGILLPVFGNYLTDRNIPRDWDLIVGAGAQIRLLCNLDLTADVRVDIPDPVKLANRDCVGTEGQRINTWNALGNALGGTQVFLGLLLHN